MDNIPLVPLVAALEAASASWEASGVAMLVAHHHAGEALPGTALHGTLDAAVDALLAPLRARLSRDGHERPVVIGTDARVSFAYTAGVAVTAISRDPVLGVDVERDRVLRGADPLAALVCSRAERAALPLDPVARRHQLLEMWTRKEAVLKAWGTGLAIPPALVEAGAGAGRRRVAAPAGTTHPGVTTLAWTAGALVLACATSDERVVSCWHVALDYLR